jgi:hypothetical protein
VKTAIVALSAAALIAAAPAALARNSKTQNEQYQASQKHPRIVSGNSPHHAMHASSLRRGNPGAFGYPPSAPKDYTTESSRQAGGGGGGGGGSGM